jgi:hypothetical protein
VLGLRAAKRPLILFHQDWEDLLAEIDAEIKDRILRAGAEHRKQDLDGHGLREINESSLFLPHFNSFWDIRRKFTWRGRHRNDQSSACEFTLHRVAVERRAVTWSKLIRLPLYPLFCSILIVLVAYQQVKTLFDLSDILRPMIVLGAISLLGVALLSRLLRQRDKAAAISMLILLILLHESADRALSYFYMGLTLVYVLMSVKGLIDDRVTLIVNVVTAALLITPVYEILRFKMLTTGDQAMISSPFNDLMPEEFSGTPPNIVHIVLDGYSGQEVLRDFYGYDSSPFVSSLHGMGFQVASNARAPYNQTLFSMVSIFSGVYAGDQASVTDMTSSAALRLNLGNLVSNGPANQLMERLGYQRLATEAGYAFLSQHTVDTNVIEAPRSRSALTLFESFLWSRAWANRLRATFFSRDQTGNATSNRLHALLRNALDQRTWREAKPPFFLYQHMLAPHPPFNVDATGALTDEWLEHFGGILSGDHATLGEPDLQKEYREGYLAKLRFIEREVQSQIAVMIAEVPSPKIIILHGDHGGGSSLFQDDSQKTCQMERMTTLLAIYTDDPGLASALSSVEEVPTNLVNSYRLIFGHYFPGSIAPLEDKSHFVTWSTPQKNERISEERLTSPCNDDQETRGNW